MYIGNTTYQLPIQFFGERICSVMGPETRFEMYNFFSVVNGRQSNGERRRRISLHQHRIYVVKYVTYLKYADTYIVETV
jgi:hypothetical protein